MADAWGPKLSGALSFLTNPLPMSVTPGSITNGVFPMFFKILRLIKVKYASDEFVLLIQSHYLFLTELAWGSNKYSSTLWITNIHSTLCKPCSCVYASKLNHVNQSQIALLALLFYGIFACFAFQLLSFTVITKDEDESHLLRNRRVQQKKTWRLGGSFRFSCWRFCAVLG